MCSRDTEMVPRNQLWWDSRVHDHDGETHRDRSQLVGAHWLWTAQINLIVFFNLFCYYIIFLSVTLSPLYRLEIKLHNIFSDHLMTLRFHLLILFCWNFVHNITIFNRLKTQVLCFLHRLFSKLFYLKKSIDNKPVCLNVLIFFCLVCGLLRKGLIE